MNARPSGGNLVSWEDVRGTAGYGPPLLPSLISMPNHYGMMTAEEVAKRGQALIVELADAGEDVDCLSSWPSFAPPPSP